MGSRKNYSRVGELDKLLHWIDHVRKASRKFTLVAEHKNDRDLLRALKCKNVCYPLEPYTDFVDLIANYERPVILLYDCDRQSNKKCSKLRSDLMQRGIRVNTGFRKVLLVEHTNLPGLLKRIHQLAGSERVHRGIPV